MEAEPLQCSQLSRSIREEGHNVVPMSDETQQSSPASAGAPGPGMPGPGGSELPPNKRLMATAAVILALALTSIDVSVVSTAMPHIVGDLKGLGLYAWVGVSYGVGAAVVVPIGGKLGDMFGRKPFLLAGLLGFLASSWICGASQNMTQLIVFRGLQGLFGGLLMANIFTVVADIYPPASRAQIMGVLFSVAGLSMVVGPPLGGLITDHIGWRWIFYVNVPLVALTVVAVIAAVPYVRSHLSWRDIDFPGVVVLITALVPLLIGISLAGDGHAWGSAEVLAPVIVGAVMLIVFYLVESRRAANPVVPVELFKVNQFSVMTVVAFFSAFAMMSVLFYVPLLYQGVLGVSAGFSGSLVIPLTLALMVVPPIAGKVLTKVPRYRFVGTFAFASMIGGLLLLTTVDPHTNHFWPVFSMVLVGLGIGIAFPMATTVAQSSVSMQQIGAATSQVQFWRMVAGPVSIAVLGTIMSGTTGGAKGGASAVSQDALTHSLHQLFGVCAALVAIGLLATLVLKEIPLRPMPKMGGGRKKKPAAEPARSAAG
ncbi:drug resistance transporter, EmrB/QacA subfamily [Catenulispora acidiphila DSM 44928]|uniref:Drug resistance transporter, EmrB/QacA subfamily n=2 Tax=Catenulispora TaxID=414878 RepID=C7PXP5_CATAD|nr:drug resistance transporter, EmrB/QacA subfamily [Catenulispora acidiphila DSM 44928]